MKKKKGLPDDFCIPSMEKMSPQGPDYNLDPLGFLHRPRIKVPKEMYNKLNEIAKASFMEPWEVIQELLEYRFKESA